MQNENPNDFTKATNFSSSDYTPEAPQLNRRKTGIALSVITCLFMLVIGYEISRGKDNEIVENKPETIKAKQPLIFSKQKDKQKLIAFADNNIEYVMITPDNELENLREKTGLQEEKINALRLEVLTANKKLHDIKPGLFGNYNLEQSRIIAELNRMLAANDEAFKSLNRNIQNLEIELLNSSNTIQGLEITTDSLFEIMEVHRDKIDQTESFYKDKIDEIELAFETDKKELIDQVSEHKHTREQLEKVLDKEKTLLQIVELQLNATRSERDELKEQNRTMEHALVNTRDHSNEIAGRIASKEKLLAVRELELHTLMNALTTIHQGTSNTLRDVGNLQTLLQEARMLAQSLQNELDGHKVILEAKQDHIDKIAAAHEETAISLAEEIAALNSKLEQSAQQVESMEISLTSYQNALTENEQELAVKQSEYDRLFKIHNSTKYNLESAIAKLEQNLLETNQKSAELEESLRMHQEDLMSKQNEIEKISVAHQADKTDLSAEIAGLTSLLHDSAQKLASLEQTITFYKKMLDSKEYELNSTSDAFNSNQQALRDKEADKMAMAAEIAGLTSLLHDSAQSTATFEQTIKFYKKLLESRDNELNATSDAFNSNQQALSDKEADKMAMAAEIAGLTSLLHDSARTSATLQQTIMFYKKLLETKEHELLVDEVD